MTHGQKNINFTPQFTFTLFLLINFETNNGVRLFYVITIGNLLCDRAANTQYRNFGMTSASKGYIKKKSLFA
jgi:hypothetical protein